MTPRGVCQFCDVKNGNADRTLVVEGREVVNFCPEHEPVARAFVLGVFPFVQAVAIRRY